MGRQQSKQEIWQINQILMFWTFIAIIITVLKYASDLLVPLLMAVALSIILSPLLTYLEKKRIPKTLSLFGIVLISMIPIVILGGHIGEEVTEFANNFPQIKNDFNISLEKFTLNLNSFGIGITQNEIHEIFEKSNFGQIIKKLVSQTGSQFSNIFLIFFLVAFMLMESDSFYNKMIHITKSYHKDLDEVSKINEKIKSYFLIKVKTSLMTAIWVLLVLWFYDIKYIYLWATLAFFLNFIPVVGSILAAVPPIIMVVIDQTVMTALWIAMWYLIINTVIGNIIEPRIMGKGLGLSALVILISMTFWGWVFGPIGMILSVPLTMVVQFHFNQYSETKWIALLLSDYKNQPLETKDK